MVDNTMKQHALKGKRTAHIPTYCYAIALSCAVNILLSSRVCCNGSMHRRRLATEARKDTCCSDRRHEALFGCRHKGRGLASSHRALQPDVAHRALWQCWSGRSAPLAFPCLGWLTNPGAAAGLPSAPCRIAFQHRDMFDTTIICFSASALYS